jgi:hypothetical protein
MSAPIMLPFNHQPINAFPSTNYTPPAGRYARVTPSQIASFSIGPTLLQRSESAQASGTGSGNVYTVPTGVWNASFTAASGNIQLRRGPFTTNLGISPIINIQVVGGDIFVTTGVVQWIATLIQPTRNPSSYWLAPGDNASSGGGSFWVEEYLSYS